jgi:hypothetical protein
MKGAKLMSIADYKELRVYKLAYDSAMEREGRR